MVCVSEKQFLHTLCFVTKSILLVTDIFWVILVKKAQEGFLDGFEIFWKEKIFMFQFFYSKVLY